MTRLLPGSHAILRLFFNLNAGALKDLAESLLEKRIIGRDGIIPFLREVKLPEGFPCPTDRI